MLTETAVHVYTPTWALQVYMQQIPGKMYGVQPVVI